MHLDEQLELQDKSLNDLATRARAMGCDPQWLAMTCQGAGEEAEKRAKLVHWCFQHAKEAREKKNAPSVASVGVSDTIGVGKSPAAKAPPQRKSRGRRGPPAPRRDADTAAAAAAAPVR